MKTNDTMANGYHETIVIGAGQAGLAAAYYLSKSGNNFIILDGHGRVGDSWRKRWDSLKLFTPSQYCGLPGDPFPSARNSMPTKDEVADYLETYALKAGFNILHDEKVNKISAQAAGFEIRTGKNIFSCENVIIAIGTNQVPKIPAFAKDLNPGIFQVHSSQYINPDSLPAGDVLVVGAGTSGVEIALELSRSRKTVISGRPTFHIPDPVVRYSGGLYWWFVTNVVTVDTPLGRKAKEKIRGGSGPLVNVSAIDLVNAGVEQVPRITTITEGLPVTGDGRRLKVSSVVWSTGFRPDYSWFDIDLTYDQAGWPSNRRGISSDIE